MNKYQNILVKGLLLSLLITSFMACSKKDEETEEPNDYCYIDDITLGTLTRYEYSTNEASETETTTITYSGAYYPIAINQLTGTITNTTPLLQNTDRTIVPLTIEGEGNAYYRKQSEEDGWMEFTDGDVLDFTEPIVFRIVATNGGSSRDYTMSLTVRDNNPEDYTWEQMMPKEGVANPMEGRAQRKAVARHDGLAIVSTDANGNIFLTTAASTQNPTWTDAACTGASGADVTSLQSYNGKLWMSTTTGTLLQSEDGRAWSSVGQSQVQSVKLLAASEKALYALVNGCDICSTTDGTTWDIINLDGEKSLFPTDDFASVAFTKAKGTSRVLLVGQASSASAVWNLIVDDDEPWAYYANPSGYALPWSSIQGKSLVSYSSTMKQINGEETPRIIAIGKSATTYYSTDQGYTWHEYTYLTLNDSQRPADNEYIAATAAGEYIWFFTGNRIWRARVNNYGE